MGRQNKDAVKVTRRHRADPVSCEEAIRLLLAFSEKEGGSAPALDNAKVRSKNDSRAKESIREND
jgi:hypothetical protein